MAAGYYKLTGVTVSAGGTTLGATGMVMPDGSTVAVNFNNLVGQEGSASAPSGHVLLGPAGQHGIVKHALTATSIELAAPWIGAAINPGDCYLILGINALPTGRLITQLIQILNDRPLIRSNALAEFLGDAAAQGAALTNLGFSAAGKALVAAADLAAQQALLKQKWKTVVDSVLPSAAQAFQFSLGGYRRVRGRISVSPNPAAAANFGILWFSSIDNGASFGVTDYVNVINSVTATGATQSAGGATAGSITSQAVAKAGSSIQAMIEFEFDAGTGLITPRMSGRATYFDGTAYRMDQFLGQRQVNGPVTDLRIVGVQAASFSAGSTIVVEGC